MILVQDQLVWNLRQTTGVAAFVPEEAAVDGDEVAVPWKELAL